jgi:hypothetical protein
MPLPRFEKLSAVKTHMRRDFFGVGGSMILRFIDTKNSILQNKGNLNFPLYAIGLLSS